MTRDEQIKIDLAAFTEEVIFADPEWAKERRVEYIMGQVLQIFEEMAYWREVGKRYPLGDWWKEAIYESIIQPQEKQLLRMITEIQQYEEPTPINYEDKITDNDIQNARDVPLDFVSGLEFRTAGSNAQKAVCPFHTEDTPSFIWHTDRNTYHCFGCNVHGDVIDYTMKTRNMNFREAVRHLLNRY